VIVALTKSDGEPSAAQQPPRDEPLFLVESFPAARNAGDVFGATGWCAAVLELQDIDGQWFVDEPTTRSWLRQLTDKYFVETLSPPVANGNTVTWTERLTLRSAQPSGPWSMIMTVEASAVDSRWHDRVLECPCPRSRFQRGPSSSAGGK
jgi:hypothetical protein